MRAIPEELAARLAGGATTLAYLWRVERRDGAVFGFTNHDEALTIDGVVYEAATGLMAGAIEKSLGLAIDTASAEGALSSAAIDAGDLAAGLWDGARVDISRVDWSDTALRVALFAGRLGEIRRGEAGFAAEMRGLQAAYNAPMGRVFSRFCDAELGDARCAVDLGAPAYRGEGVVSDVIGAGAFKAAGLDAFAPGWFTRGALIWASGARAEIAAHRAEAGVILELARPAPIATGAAFVVTAGCDKRLETCRAKFANVLNFRGFPHMPGNDAVQAGPAEDGNDGRSRWTD
jgi:uncharacterized phage protein (TIGR02218 family)